MRLLYIDFNEGPLENYSRTPNRYGGGRAVASYLLPYLNDNGHLMHIWADRKCFENIEEKYQKYCCDVSWKIRRGVGTGAPLKLLTGTPFEYDIVLHHNGGFWVNCEGLKTIPMYWSVGYGEQIHEGNQNIILYNDYQNPQPRHPNPKFFKARIGVPIPPFREYVKEDFVFSCHRQVNYFGSELMCKLAHELNFRYITAGPLDSMCNITRYADNKNVTYLGVIDSKTKQDYLSRAKCTTYLHSWNTPFNLSACESLAVGTPIITTGAGFFPSFVKNGINGFMVNSISEFKQKLNEVSNLSQKNCYDSVLPYSSDLMVQDYIKIFEQVLNEKL